MSPSGTAAPRRRSLLKLSLVLGTLGCGGGMALIAMARHQLGDKEHWLDDETFLRDLAIAQSVPGTMASNLITVLGLRAGGWRTALACLIVFILPSVVLMGVLGAVYGQARTFEPIAVLLAGLGPAVVAITLAVGLQLLRRVRAKWQWVVAAIAAALIIARLLTVFEIILLTAGGALIGSLVRQQRPALQAVSLPALAWVFVQISLSMFGGGLAMITAVAHQLVEQRHWLPAQEFADGVGLSQITPGPLATAATFFGYRIDGLPGAVVATLGIFVPATALVFLASRFLQNRREQPTVKLVLEALSAATLGLILAASVSLARSGGIAPHLPQGAIDAGLVGVGLAVLLRGVGPLWVLGGTVVLHAGLGFLLPSVGVR